MPAANFPMPVTRPWEPSRHDSRGEAPAGERRELTAEIEAASPHHETVPTGWTQRDPREIRARKRERRERVAALAREGLSTSMIAQAADLTRSTVAKLSSSG